MRHKKTFNHLGRKSEHRKAMLSNMASSLIMHKRIQTTTAKAKALRRYVEPLISKSREDSTHTRRVVFSYLQDKEAVSELFREVSPKVGDRPGGYTRIIKLGVRQGDSAEMCLIELVDYNENLLALKASEKKSASRRRRGSKPRGGKTATAESPQETVKAPVAGDEVTEETAPETSASAEVVESPETEEAAAEEPSATAEDAGASEEEDTEKKE